MISFNAYSQTQQLTIDRIESKLITNQGISFIGELKDRNSDLYAFTKWSNEGTLFLNGKSYRFSNINFNVSSNSFDSRISRDKLFTFKSSEIDSVLINDLLFKKIGNTFYEVLVENGDNLFLKKHDITFQHGIENRLGGNTLGKTKTLIAFNYLVKAGEKFKRVELNKSSIIGLLENSNERESLLNFVKKEKLSYKKVNDVIRIFKFILENSSKII